MSEMEEKQPKKTMLVKQGIAFRPEIFETLSEYAKEFCKGNVTQAVNTILKKSFSKVLHT